MDKTIKKTIVPGFGIKVIHNEYMGYAVFEACYNCTDRIQFWQQISKWYTYKGYALKIYNKKIKEMTKNC